MNRLFDETTDPPLRALFGDLLANAATADVAVGNVRLGALDFAADDRVTARLRILLGRFEAGSMGGIVTARQIEILRRMVASDNVQLRSAGVGLWVPDFSVYRGLRARIGCDALCLVGAHYFHAPPSSTGPSFTCAITDRAAVDRAAARFNALWARGHDVRAVIDDALRRMHADVADSR